MTDLGIEIDPKLTKSDKLILEHLGGHDGGTTADQLLASLEAERRQPCVFLDYDLEDFPGWFRRWVLDPYVRVAGRVVREPTDVASLTGLLYWCVTIVPSGAVLFLRRDFSYLHGVVHLALTVHSFGHFFDLLHNHVHRGGVLRRTRLLRPLDALVPYVMGPLFGHTWNSFYYHHRKIHHLEDNGPTDLSSTLAYQRDDPWHLACYVLRFFLLVSLELPLHFVTTRWWPAAAAKAFFWEWLSLGLLAWGMRSMPKPTTFVFLIPLLMVRSLGMISNWGHHAFLDPDDPQSDYGSATTTLDGSNRVYGAGYHLSHHRNPRRFWRDHPLALVKSMEIMGANNCVVFYGIGGIEISLLLVTKQYEKLARAIVPINDAQRAMSLDGRVAFLKSRVRALTAEEIKEKWAKKRVPSKTA